MLVHKGSQVESEVRYWSDFLRCHLHPRTCHLLSAGQGTDFDDVTSGWELWQEQRSVVEDFEDNLHYFVEECDSLQGFHIVADSNTAFAGFTTSALTMLQDEFDKTPVVTFGCETPLEPSNRTEFHESVFVSRMLQLSSLYVPLAPPSTSTSLRLSPHSIYRSSAILAAAIETATLPTRTHKFSVPLGEMVSPLSLARIARLHLALPLQLRPEQPLPPLLEQLSLHGNVRDGNTIDELSRCTRATHLHSAVSVLRGVPGPSLDRDIFHPDPAARRQLAHDTLDGFLKRHGAIRYRSHVINHPLPVPVAFPRVFDSDVGRYGERGPNETGEVVSCPALSVLSTDDGLGKWLTRASTNLHPRNPFIRDFGWGCSEDMEEHREALETAAGHLAPDDFDD